MAHADIGRTTLKIEAGSVKEYIFLAQGQRIIFPGFLKALIDKKDNSEEFQGEKDIILPKVKKGQILKIKDPKKPLKLEQLFTKPPPRYSEASLVKKLELHIL